MRVFFVAFSILFFTVNSYAQVSKIDSLSAQLAKEKTDTNKVTLLWRLAEQYQSFNPDTSLQLAQKALLMAQRIKFIEGESRSLALLATSQFLLGDYPDALNNYILKLKIEENRKSPRNFASALNNIGLMYILLGEYKVALSYLYRADSTVESTGGKAKEELKYSITSNIGETWYRMKKPDSASSYFKKALLLSQQSGDKFSLGASMLGEANVLALQQHNPEALQFYRSSFNYLNDGMDNDMLCEVSLGMAKVYEELNNKDSAAFFGNMSFALARNGHFLSRQLDAATFLSRHFKKQHIYDSAFAYIEQSITLKDSLKGEEKTKETMIISSKEQLRQVALAEDKIRQKEIRFQQLQLLFIAIFIPLFFLVTLFISRIRIHVAVVRFMGIISLLMLFEYLTLLLHPLVANLTHHIPVLELLIFVAMGAGLIPLHHRMEHWLIAKLIRDKHIGVGHVH